MAKSFYKHIYKTSINKKRLKQIIQPWNFTYVVIIDEAITNLEWVYDQIGKLFE